jgi:hypothetical protein
MRSERRSLLTRATPGCLRTLSVRKHRLWPPEPEAPVARRSSSRRAVSAESMIFTRAHSQALPGSLHRENARATGPLSCGTASPGVAQAPRMSVLRRRQKASAETHHHAPVVDCRRGDRRVRRDCLRRWSTLIGLAFIRLPVVDRTRVWAERTVAGERPASAGPLDLPTKQEFLGEAPAAQESLTPGTRKPGAAIGRTPNEGRASAYTGGGCQTIPLAEYCPRALVTRL